MAQNRESALQRIQVGVTGLVVVLLFVSLASMVNERAIDNGDALAVDIPLNDAEEEAPDEPLAELGLAPVEDPEEEEAKAAAEAEAAAEAPNMQIETEDPVSQ